MNAGNSPDTQLVRIPMMPKGVEHGACDTNRKAQKPVRIPMMPKGVEHAEFAKKTRTHEGVRIPMMPKGVEHYSCSTPFGIVDKGAAYRPYSGLQLGRQKLPLIYFPL